MSVPLGQRELSYYEFYNNAVILQNEVIILCTSRMPKSWRYVFSVPMCNNAMKMLDEIIAGFSFYPNNEEFLMQRKIHYTEAIAACKSLKQGIETLLAVKGSACLTYDEQVSDTVKITKQQLKYVPKTELERLMRLCIKEEKLLVGAKSHAKLIKDGNNK